MKLNVLQNDSEASITGTLPCDTCDTNCCKEYLIFVNAHDIYRLSAGLGLDPMSFLEIHGAKDFDLGINADEGLLDLALKQNDGGCIFLEESKDIFRCTVNDIKPSVCKSYPFQMKNGKLTQMGSKMCPVDWNVEAFEMMMATHLKKDAHEWNFYDKLVVEWNSKRITKRPLSLFLKFMMDKVGPEFSNNC